MGTVATVEDFWQLHQLIKPPSFLGLANDYAMFRQVCESNHILKEIFCFMEFRPNQILQQGVNPDWDDPANSSGGR